MKRTISKKSFCFDANSFTAFAIQAQEKGDMAAGLNLSYGTKAVTAILGSEPSFSTVLPMLSVSSRQLPISSKRLCKHVGYQCKPALFIPCSRQVRILSLAGVSLLGAKADLGDSLKEYGVKASASETKFGANLGAGAQYWLTDNFALAFEIKYQLVSDYDRPVFTLGAAYKF